MLYRVTKQYTRGADTIAAQFVDINDAKLFIQTKLAEDARFKVNVTYRLFEGTEMIEEFAAGSQGAGSASGSSGGGQQRSSSQSFQPTPFNASPRPAGLPHNWVKDQDKKEDDK